MFNTACHWDAGSTVSEWQPKHRPAIYNRPSLHLRQRRVMGPMNIAWSVLRLQRHCRPYVHRNWIFLKVDREADRTTKRNFYRTSAMLSQEDVKWERYVAVVVDIVIWVCQDMHAPIGQWLEKVMTFLKISDDYDGKFSECCHDDVLYRCEQFSHVIVYVREQCCHMDVCARVCVHLCSPHLSLTILSLNSLHFLPWSSSTIHWKSGILSFQK